MRDTMENPSIMSHVSVGVTDFAASLKFYDQVLATIGATRIMDHPGATGYGRNFPEFWVQTPHNGEPPSVGNGTHFGFTAATKAQVDAFFAAAIEAGGTSDGDPGPRSDYGPAYYGCFVRDLDGHKIEAAFWDASLA